MHDPDDARRATPYGTIVIGAGQAGPTVADRLASPDHRVALVEADRYGGTCPPAGTTPADSSLHRWRSYPEVPLPLLWH